MGLFDLQNNILRLKDYYFKFVTADAIYFNMLNFTH